jgi:hypothetical protein
VNGRRVGRHQHIELAEFVGDRSAVEGHCELPGIGVDIGVIENDYDKCITLSPGAKVQPNRSTLRSPAAACSSMFSDRAPTLPRFIGHKYLDGHAFVLLAAPAGRADDFSWPRPDAGVTTPDIAPTASNPAAPQKKVDEAKKPADVGNDNKNKVGKESAGSKTRRSRNADLDGAQASPAPGGSR